MRRICAVICSTNSSELDGNLSVIACYQKVRNKIVRVSSKSLGLIAVVLSIATIPVLYSVHLFPAFLSTVLAALLVTATVCSILAARRGSKLWLLMTLWPVAFAVCSRVVQFHGLRRHSECDRR
jgi:hypothetical protein